MALEGPNQTGEWTNLTDRIGDVDARYLPESAITPMGSGRTEPIASKRSFWMITTGRGLPAEPLPAAAVRISSRVMRRRG